MEDGKYIRKAEYSTNIILDYEKYIGKAEYSTNICLDDGKCIRKADNWIMANTNVGHITVQVYIMYKIRYIRYVRYSFINGLVF